MTRTCGSTRGSSPRRALPDHGPGRPAAQPRRDQGLSALGRQDRAVRALLRAPGREQAVRAADDRAPRHAVDDVLARRQDARAAHRATTWRCSAGTRRRDPAPGRRLRARRGTVPPATECRLNGDRRIVCTSPPDPPRRLGTGALRARRPGAVRRRAARQPRRARPRVAAGHRRSTPRPRGHRPDALTVTADVVYKATEIITSPDGGDVYVMGVESGVLSLSADRVTGALSAPRCTMAWTGTASCPATSGGGALPQSAEGSMVLDPTGRDIYTTDELPDFKYGIARFLRTTRPPGGRTAHRCAPTRTRRRGRARRLVGAPAAARPDLP